MIPQKKIVIFTGGTTTPITPHLSLCAPAYGTIGQKIAEAISNHPQNKMETVLIRTKMAGGDSLSTNEDLLKAAKEVVADYSTKIVFMTAAVCDFEVDAIDGGDISFFRDKRLSSDRDYEFWVKGTQKILPIFREKRKDIFLVAFSTTSNASKEEMFLKAQRVMKQNSANLVVANDIGTRKNFIATPEESIYSETEDRDILVKELVEISLLRSNLTFTRSTVVDGKPISWNDDRVPPALRKVVDYCIEQGAYKPIQGKTAGHFAIRLSDTEFLTSIRKTDFNDLKDVGLVYVKTDGPDTVLAYGAKPSVGGQSQRIVFKDHPGKDCIVHFHCPKKEDSDIPVVSQREYECGSHECGKNTSRGLKYYLDGKIAAVMLDNHGPNIVFSKNEDPEVVIEFIKNHFDLSKKTGPSWDK